MTSIAKLGLSPKTPETAEGTARTALENSRKNLGFVPNMYASMANSPGLLDNYLQGYDRFRKESGFTPAEQETVFLTISRANGCTYCMAAHSMIGEKMSKLPGAALEALRQGRPIAEQKLQALSAFTRVMVESHGRPSVAQLEAFVGAGYGERHVLEIILAIAVKTISNYSNHVFHSQVDPAFAAYAWRQPESA